jgi:hypothetical protein
MKREAYLVIRRDSRDLRDERDGLEASSLRVAPVAHVLLVSLTIHERREGRAERRTAEQALPAPRDVGLQDFSQLFADFLFE